MSNFFFATLAVFDSKGSTSIQEMIIELVIGMGDSYFDYR